jgi:hypothetical protein
MVIGCIKVLVVFGRRCFDQGSSKLQGHSKNTTLDVAFPYGKRGLSTWLLHAVLEASVQWKVDLLGSFQAIASFRWLYGRTAYRKDHFEHKSS